MVNDDVFLSFQDIIGNPIRRSLSHGAIESLARDIAHRLLSESQHEGQRSVLSIENPFISGEINHDRESRRNWPDNRGRVAGFVFRDNDYVVMSSIRSAA